MFQRIQLAYYRFLVNHYRRKRSHAGRLQPRLAVRPVSSDVRNNRLKRPMRDDVERGIETT